jgi:hypothetical protein
MTIADNEDFEARLERLERDNERLRAELAQLRDHRPVPTAPDVPVRPATGGFSRRRLLQGIGTATAAGAGLVATGMIGGTRPAGATHALGFGHQNNMGAEATYLSGNMSESVFNVLNAGTGAAISAIGSLGSSTEAVVSGLHQGLGPALLGTISNGSNPAAAVHGSTNGPGFGVRGQTTGGGAAVRGSINNGGSSGHGVHGTVNGHGHALFGEVDGLFDANGNAIRGVTTGTAGALVAMINNAQNASSAVLASTNGRGVALEAQGGRAPLLLTPATTAGPPTADAHQKGELFVDSAGLLWLCTTSGTAGTWVRSLTSADGGAFAPVAPTRILDTRTGGGAPVGAGAANERVVQVTGGGGVPTNAAAVALNLTVTQGSADGDFVTLYPDGTTRPTASNINFNAGQTLANFAIVKLGTSGSLRLYNQTGTVHVLLDVAGFYV